MSQADSRRTGFQRLNATSNNNVFTITAHPGLLPKTNNLNNNNNNSANNDQSQQDPKQEVEIVYSDLKTIGNGSFGVVFQATLQKPTKEQIAIKKVLQDKRFKNRELQIMRKLDHCNVVKLKYFFHTMGDRGNLEVYLHLVLEYIPETLYKIARTHSRTRQNLPMLSVKLYMYQLFRSLNYIHSMDICHRDIKPQNLLLNPETGVLKLCDFGSAKSLVGGEPNVAYICSRYYRAPELIFGAIDYTTKIDIWSAGCVMAELILGEPMFPGESGVDQLVEIIKVLGTPTREQMKAMNPNYTEFRFPVIRARSWNRVFGGIRAPPEAAKLVSQLLEYTPSNRLTPLAACAHPFFDELRSSPTKLLSNGREFPPLFNFSDEELRKEPHLATRLMPNQISDSLSQQQQQQQIKREPTTITSASSALAPGVGPTAASSDSVAASSSNSITTPCTSSSSNVNPNSSNKVTATTESPDDSSSGDTKGQGVISPNGSSSGSQAGSNLSNPTNTSNTSAQQHPNCK